MAPNGSRLCEVADFQHKCSIEKLNLNLALKCQDAQNSPFGKADVGGSYSFCSFKNFCISAFIVVSPTSSYGA